MSNWDHSDSSRLHRIYAQYTVSLTTVSRFAHRRSSLPNSWLFLPKTSIFIMTSDQIRGAAGATFVSCNCIGDITVKTCDKIVSVVSYIVVRFILNSVTGNIFASDEGHSLDVRPDSSHQYQICLPRQTQ